MYIRSFLSSFDHTKNIMTKRGLSPDPPRAKIPRPSPYQVLQTQHRTARRLGYEERSFRATFNQDYVGHRLLDIHQELEDIFKRLLTEPHNTMILKIEPESSFSIMTSDKTLSFT